MYFPYFLPFFNNRSTAELKQAPILKCNICPPTTPPSCLYL